MALCVRLCLFLLLAASLSAADKPFGVWWRGGPNAAELKQRAPWVRGVFVAIKWSQLEPQQGKYDWTSFDETFTRYARAGLYIQFMVWVGPDSPRWIYSAGVPEVKTTPSLDPRGNPNTWTYPFYLDPDYRTHFFRMTRDVAQHIDTLPPDVRAKIICIQTAEGTTGDEGGYKGAPLDQRYKMPEEQWTAFKFETWRLFEELYSKKTPKIFLLTNSGNYAQYHEWLLKNMPRWWRKAGNPGHGYQLNNEAFMLSFFDPLINHPESGTFIRARSEMDELFKGWFREAPVWNMYWLNLWGLHFGLDIFQHGTQAFADPRDHEGFAFYDRYGGEKDAATSPGAFCALHDGLDAADFRRFPESQFGPGKFGQGDLRSVANAAERKNSIPRMTKIAEAFGKYGARQGDPEKGAELVMENRSAKLMNDVGWIIESGNYQRYMKQYDPIATSQGFWRVGPKDQPYGRFARGFDAAGGKNAMYFDIADRFFGGKPLAGAYPVEVRVIYFDSGRGSWTLRYDSVKNNEKTALSVKNTDSGRWREARVTLKDANFGNRCPHSTDLTLVNASRENTLFHMIEVLRRK